MERWQWAAEQRRNTTKCDFTITTGQRHLGFFFLSSANICYLLLFSLAGLPSLAPDCCCPLKLLAITFVSLSSLGTTTSSYTVCLSVPRFLLRCWTGIIDCFPAVLAGFYRLDIRLRKSSASSRIFNIASRRLICFFCLSCGVSVG